VSADDVASRLGRLRRLDTLADEDGIFALAAIDHRDSLRVAFEKAGHATPTPAGLAQLKATVARALAPHATGLLLDVELGAAALAAGAPGPCGVVVPLEAQGYEEVSSGRVTTLLEGFSPALAARLGAAACKLLLPYRPDLPDSAARQDEVVKGAAGACHAQGLPLVLEPIVYARPGEDEATFAAAFPGLVVETAARLQPLGPDVLKLQFPRSDGPQQAAWCARLDAACAATPWVLLGGGGAADAFARELAAAVEAGASGFIAGRTLWSGVVGAGTDAEAWLRATGVPLLRSLHGIARNGRRWRERIGPVEAPAADWFSPAATT
jgi:sulfofructosephosphate aldolase